jgi:hypothetical protein
MLPTVSKAKWSTIVFDYDREYAGLLKALNLFNYYIYISTFSKDINVFYDHRASQRYSNIIDIFTLVILPNLLKNY